MSGCASDEMPRQDLNCYEAKRGFRSSLVQDYCNLLASVLNNKTFGADGHLPCSTFFNIKYNLLTFSKTGQHTAQNVKYKECLFAHTHIQPMCVNYVSTMSHAACLLIDKMSPQRHFGSLQKHVQNIPLFIPLRKLENSFSC